ncbi:MAG: ubiquinone/menaquinone biosynthesis methyltransferase [Dehalococcoidia bacterium]|nr:ubiquinone/menaquinone biosynthesis methyltransferase [Dehalococcoidia bacterium]
MTTPRWHCIAAEHNRRMFSRIAHRYDLLNRVMTLGRDGTWRQAAAALAAPKGCRLALDMATGTGELAFALASRAEQVVAVDISPQMLTIAHAKARARPRAGRIQFLLADGLRLPFAADTFDCIATGFALRNVVDLGLALAEMHRVVRPGGRVVCLELTRSPSRLLAALHALCLAGPIPALGHWLAGDSSAYRFLSTSLRQFPDAQQLAKAMRNRGFRRVAYRLYRLWPIALHVGIK